jgi:3-oxoacyl-[acyl-carrier protein] reductase
MRQKAAIVTGATRGIGLGIAQRLLQEGWAVLGTGTGTAQDNHTVIAQLQEGNRPFFYRQCNIANEEDRRALVEGAFHDLECVDALINNAGTAPKQRMDMLDLTSEAYDHLMDINLKGTFFLTQAVSRKLILQTERISERRPVIVFLSSISAYTASVNRAEYCISKAGLSQAVQLFAERLSGHGINVYEIRPGLIQTDMTARVRDKYDGMIAGGLLPIKRWGKPEDIAAAVWAVCSGLLPYSTGEVLNVDGGFHMRRL